MAVTLVAVNMVMLPMATILVALRCYIRVVKRTFGWDDWMILFGYVRWLHIYYFRGSMKTRIAANGFEGSVRSNRCCLDSWSIQRLRRA